MAKRLSDKADLVNGVVPVAQTQIQVNYIPTSAAGTQVAVVQNLLYTYGGVLYRYIGTSGSINPTSITTDTTNWRLEAGVANAVGKAYVDSADMALFQIIQQQVQNLTTLLKIVYLQPASNTFAAVADSVYAYGGNLYRRVGPSATVSTGSITTDTNNWRLEIGGNTGTATVDDSNFVHKTGNESIGGNKTFTSTVVAPYFKGDGSQLTNLPKELTADQQDAVNHANNPNFGNPFLTKNDLQGSGNFTQDEIDAINNSVAPGAGNPFVTYSQLPPGAPPNTDFLAEGNSNLYYTDARAQAAVASQVAAKADLVNGKVPAAQIPYVGFVPISLRSDVTGLKYANGEVDTSKSTIPAASTPGMEFIFGNGTTTYVYRYMLSSYDSNGTRFTWVRMLAN